MNKFLVVGFWLSLSAGSTFAKTELISQATSVETAVASLNDQLTNIVGAWDSGYSVFLIQVQSENSIKAYRCNRARYIADRYCAYDRILVGHYNSHFDGFCVPWEGKSCPTGFQVSLQHSNQMLEIVDPLHIYDVNNRGTVHELRKL